MVSDSKYIMSFTAGSLMQRDAHVLAELYKKHNDWRKVRDEVFKERLLQTRTESSAVRYFREARNRLMVLNEVQREIIINGSIDEQKHMIWWSICKLYRYIKEFAIEVVIPKYRSKDFVLTHIDYIHFKEQKTELDDALGKMTQKSQDKQEQVIFRMLREAGITDKNFNIQSVSLTRHIVNALEADKPDSFNVFPMPEGFLRGLL